MAKTIDISMRSASRSVHVELGIERIALRGQPAEIRDDLRPPSPGSRDATRRLLHVQGPAIIA